VPFERFDPSRLRLRPLAERVHDLDLSVMRRPDEVFEPFDHPALDPLADAVAEARRRGAAVILMLGGHVLRTGNGPLIIDLMERGVLTHVAMNGSGAIHDFEFALIGRTTESVARYIRTGEFGLWRETGRLNDIVRDGAAEDLGFGEAVGRHIHDAALPHADVSVLAAGYRLRVPVTVHAAIGQDIVHEHPNVDAAAIGRATYADFLVFTGSVGRLEGGVLLSFGSAVMAPEVYLKALAMARNVAGQEGGAIRHVTTAVFDLVDLGPDPAAEAPKTDPRYYFRPQKTLLVRTVADGGTSYYVRGDHRLTFPNLYRRIRERIE
jgi:hypothetical protein